MHVVWHDDPFVQFYIRPNGTGLLPFICNDLADGGQCKLVMFDLAKEMDAILCADSNVIISRLGVIPAWKPG